MPRNQSERVNPFKPIDDPHGYGVIGDMADLVGHTITQIDGATTGSDEVTFHFKDATFKMYHSQDCCENVDLDDINGDINDLVGSPLTMAECVSEEDEELAQKQRGYVDSHTWTFYKFATIKGYVTLRWYGESNGYYSEAVTFARFK